ncbi:DUF4145 domain-containing protein [Rossellomorea aquimaris]|uniref:DUF4145 domain-containing protein n=1 Tax=Rossellomorea aquimaris TaxID=189382 RepID=UPI0016537D72|nr:DUF4145 domain-containing protein [Rossellomorea aquimaris]
MKNVLHGAWNHSISNVTKESYVCGYCGTNAGPSKGFTCIQQLGTGSKKTTGNIYICPACNKPTFIDSNKKEQYPGPVLGEEVSHLPDGISELYNEARACISVNAYTSAVLSCRKLLMNISVSKGAEEGKKFAWYVSFLEDNHFIPPNSREWVDHIRRKGNEATHELPSISRVDAIELLEFTAMLLRFVYEFPSKMEKYSIK